MDIFINFFGSAENKGEGFFSTRIKISSISLNTLDHISHLFYHVFRSQVAQTFYMLRADPGYERKSLKLHMETDYVALESPKSLPRL